MPFTMTLDYRPTPVLRLHVRRRGPLQRRLHAIADAALPRFLALWLGLLRDFRRGLHLAPLRAALGQASLLDADQYLHGIWHREVEGPALHLLPVLVMQTVSQAAHAVEPDLQALVSEDRPFRLAEEEVRTAVTPYVGTQVRLIGTTTLLVLRQVLRDGWRQEQAPTVLAQRLRLVAGLTPQQASTVERLGQEGARAGAEQEAVVVGLRKRAKGIGAMQTMAAVNMGQTLLAQQAQRQTGRALRRHWRTAENEKVCPRCAPIPALNPEGVGVREPFHTPSDGMVYDAPIHNNCRCTTETQLG